MRRCAVWAALALCAGSGRAEVVVSLPLGRQVNGALSGVTEYLAEDGLGFARTRLPEGAGAGGWYEGLAVDLVAAGIGPVDLSAPGSVIRYTARYFQGAGNTNPYGDAPIIAVLGGTDGREVELGISYGARPPATYPEWVTCVDDVPTAEEARGVDLTCITRVRFRGTDWAGKGGDYVDLREVALITPTTADPPHSLFEALQSADGTEVGVAGAAMPPREAADLLVLEDYVSCSTLRLRDAVEPTRLQVSPLGRMVVARGELRTDPASGERFLQAEWWAYLGAGPASEALRMGGRISVTCAELMDPKTFEERCLGHEAELRATVCATAPALRSVYLWDTHEPGRTAAPRLDVSAIPSWQRPSFHVGEEVTIVAACCFAADEAGRKTPVLRVRSRSDITHHLPPGNEPRTFRAFGLVFDPPCPGHEGQLTHAVMGWNDARDLAAQYIGALRDASNGWCRYEMAGWADFPTHAPFEDGYIYDPDEYIEAWRNRKDQPLHEGKSDIVRLLTDKTFAHNQPQSLAERVAAGEIDEVFLFGSPVALSASEAAMAGPEPFFINGDTYPLPEAKRNFAIMGFNYERDVDCMLEDFCHRTECTMTRVYEPPDFWFPTHPPGNLWDAFRLFDQRAPGEAANGICHYAPNSLSDYEWGNPTPVPSTCDDWLYNWPNLQGAATKRIVSCDEWGGGGMAEHHVWWLNRLPNWPGVGDDGRLRNWWKYVCDPNGY